MKNAKNENLYKELLKLQDDSRLVKTAHFISAERKKPIHLILGLSIIILNIIIFSPVVSLILPNYSTPVIKILAIASASLAGIQTFLNFQKDTEQHLSAGEEYAKIYRNTKVAVAKYKDKLVDEKTFVEDFDTLHNKYLELNEKHQLSIPSSKDYKKAIKDLKERT